MTAMLVRLLTFHVFCLQFPAAVRSIIAANQCPEYVDKCEDASGLTCDDFFTIEKTKGTPDSHIIRAMSTAPTIGYHCTKNIVNNGCKKHTWAGELEIKFYQSCACALDRRHPQWSQLCPYAGIWVEEVEQGRAVCTKCMAGKPRGNVFPSLESACAGDEFIGVMTVEDLERCSLKRPNGPQPIRWEPPRPVPVPVPKRNTDRWVPEPSPFDTSGWHPAPQQYRPAPQPAPRPYRPAPQPAPRPYRPPTQQYSPAPPESPAKRVIRDLQQELNSARFRDKASKKQLFRTLLRKWHPDKHKGDEAVATEVTGWLNTQKDNFFNGRLLSES